ncbi:hypothetical protein EBZ57_03460, partial [bacterium]|nr:hypothetical protein [bacterium]
ITGTLTGLTGLTVASGGASISGGLTVASGGASITGATTINTTGTANTQIGNATGTFQLDSSAFDVSTAGALSGITTISASGAITAATTTNTINGLIINSGALSGITGYTQTSGNFDMSASTGTFATGTGQVTMNGSTLIKPSTNAVSAFQIQNASGNNILNIDTSSNANLNLISNPSFEQNTTGWAAKGSANISTPGRNQTVRTQGLYSLGITQTANSGDGASFNYSFAPSTTYRLSFFVRTPGTTVSAISFGRTEGGVDTDCSTGNQMDNVVWRRFSCTFTTGASVGSNPAIYIKSTDTTNGRIIYIDGVMLTTGSTTYPYQESLVTLSGTIDSPVLFKNQSNSTNGFEIQNSSGTSLFQVDTGNQAIYSTGMWIMNSGTNSTLSNMYTIGSTGATAYDVVILANESGNPRATTTTTARDPRVLGINRYTATSGSSTSVMFYGQTTVNADATSTAISVGDQLVTSSTAGRVMADNNATSGIIGYATSALASGTGTVSVSLNVTKGQSTPIFRNTADGTTAFRIQNSSGTNLFTVNSSTSQLAVGSAAVPANGVLTVGTNTTAATGGIYFGTDTNLYRSAATTLKTDNAFVAGTTITAGTGLTVTTGGITVTGNSTITGTLTGLTGLTVASGGASISGGLTVASGTTINTTGTANTQIGNATGTFQLDSNTLDISSLGAISGATGITSSGTITLSGLNTAGIVKNSAAGLLSTGSVTLGTDTTGNYVATLGSLTGLTTSG